MNITTVTIINDNGKGPVWLDLTDPASQGCSLDTGAVKTGTQGPRFQGTL